MSRFDRSSQNFSQNEDRYFTLSTLVLSVRGSFSVAGDGDDESPPSFIMVANRLKLWCDDDVLNVDVAATPSAAAPPLPLSADVVDLTNGTEMDLEVVGDLENDVDLVYLTTEDAAADLPDSVEDSEDTADFANELDFTNESNLANESDDGFDFANESNFDNESDDRLDFAKESDDVTHLPDSEDTAHFANELDFTNRSNLANESADGLHFANESRDVAEFAEESSVGAAAEFAKESDDAAEFAAQSVGAANFTDDLADWVDVSAAETPPPLHRPEAATRVAVDWPAADVWAGVADGAVDVADDSDEKKEANDENDSDEEDAADDDEDGANDI